MGENTNNEAPRSKLHGISGILPKPNTLLRSAQGRASEGLFSFSPSSSQSSLRSQSNFSEVGQVARYSAKENKIVIIVGPTASGKSNLALRLAKLAQGKAFKKAGINGAEIISADSRQVYRGMDVGTGKVKRDLTFPIPKLRVKSKKLKVLLSKDFYSKEIKHHLIDVANPKKQFAVDDFKRLGQKAIQEVTAKGKTPIIVGGTGFYIDVLLGRMQIADVSPNRKLRAQLDKLTVKKLFEKLQKLDPKRAQTIDRHNKRRLVRALEIVLTTGRSSISRSQASEKYEILWLGLKPKSLEKRIKKRLNERLDGEMIGEVERLNKKGVSWKRLDDFGLEYRWISRYLRKVKSKKLKVKSFEKSEYYKNLLRDIIKYSKRQMTWFKKNREIHWIKNLREAEKFYSSFLS